MLLSASKLEIKRPSVRPSLAGSKSIYGVANDDLFLCLIWAQEEEKVADFHSQASLKPGFASFSPRASVGAMELHSLETVCSLR